MYLTREQVREVDRRAIEEFCVPGVVLMENAGRGSAELLVTLGIEGSVAICCGKGNNGGDGFVIARHLDNRGVPVKLLLFCKPEELSGDAAINHTIVARSRLPMETWTDVDQEQLREELARHAWIVDALFGTGLKGAVRPPFDRVINAINASGARVFAVDIPSGLDCDTGETPGATVRAEYTATFVTLKKCFANPSAREYTGKAHVIDIGAPRAALPRS